MKRSLQFIVFIAMVVGFIYLLRGLLGSQFTTVYTLFTTIAVLSVGIMVFLENRDPSKTVAWILLLALIPVFGILFYLMFGRYYRKRKTFDKKAEEDQKTYSFIKHHFSESMEEPYPFNEDEQRLIKLGGKLAYSPISFSTSTRILTNGEETFEAILTSLKRAKQYIHIEFYIFRADQIGTEIKDILVQKAREGIEVRFMYDAVGSNQLPSSFLDEMRAAGIQTVAFHPVRFPLLSNKMNYRNHRKIIVIDGEMGFTGGLNVGDEYLGRDKEFGFWRDTHLLLIGEAVLTLQIIFLRDWHYMTGVELPSDSYFTVKNVEDPEHGAIQIFASGPDQEWKSAKNLYFSLITMAKESIWIATPYFIPDLDILTAIQVAALSGIDVKILFPKKPDHWIPYFASHSYFHGLLEAGVEIYEYTAGFMHSKLLIVDYKISSVGTVNMDMRSFNLNFEVSALLFGEAKSRKLVENFREDLSSSHQILLEHYQKGFIKRFVESSAKLLSPLL